MPAQKPRDMTICSEHMQKVYVKKASHTSSVREDISHGLEICDALIFLQHEVQRAGFYRTASQGLGER